MNKNILNKLNDMGYHVNFRFVLDDRMYFKVQRLNPNFKKLAYTECIISKYVDTEDKKDKYSTVITTEDINYIGKAVCNKVDKFIPRIGKAIAFQRALKLVPGFTGENTNDN